MSVNLVLDGDRTTGQDVRTSNVTACVALANIVKTSLGPTGLDKMLVDKTGEVLITNDGATILNQLDVEHPAAKVLVDLADLQDQEVGDGTTSVVIVAAELLKRANELVKRGIHPTSIITGYRLAGVEASRYVQDHLGVSTDALSREQLINVAKTSMSSKIIGADPEFFASLLVDACECVKHTNDKGETRVSVPAINVLMHQGKSSTESTLIRGYAINCTRVSEAMPREVKNAKIACLDFSLQKAKTAMNAQILINDPKELAAIQKHEYDITSRRVKLLLDAGANVILTTGGIDDFTSKYFVDAGAMAVRRVKKEDLRRVARATGAQVLLNLADIEGSESVDAATLGDAECVAQESVGDHDLVLVKGTKARGAASLILRGPNTAMLDEMERSVHDVLCVLKRALESGSVVAGGGAVEASLSIYLENFATTLGSRAQLAIAEYAEALLVIPKTLAVNAACDAIDLVSKLRAHHNAAQKDETKKHLSNTGLDLEKGAVRDNLKAGVIEPTMSKTKSLKFATEAAITLLRIDDTIKLNPAPEPERDHH